MEKKIIKISAKQLQTIISEEASRYKKVLELKRKQKSIISQLNEMYEAQELQELMGGEINVDEGFKEILQKAKKAIGMQTPEEKREAALAKINSNKNLKAKYAEALSISSERGEAYIKYWEKWPNSNEGAEWDEAQKNYVPLSDVGLSNRPLAQRLGAGTSSMTTGGGAGAVKK